MIESLVNTLLQWATRRSRLVIAAAALLAGVAIAALPHLQVDTDVLHLLLGLLMFPGIGVDYAIHVVHRWRTLHDPVAVVVRLGPALLLAGGTTLAGFGTLCFSAYPRFARWASCSSPPWPERSWRR